MSGGMKEEEENKTGLPLFFHFEIQEQFKNISRTLSKIQEHKKNMVLVMNK